TKRISKHCSCLISVYQCRLAVQNNLNLRALTRHGTQDELTTDLVNSFFHSQQAEAFMFRMQVKSNTVVHKTELDFIRGNVQSSSEHLRFRVFDRVGQRLLSDSQQALFPIRRHYRLISFQMEFRLQAAAIGHALEQIVQGQAQGRILERAWTQSEDRPSRFSQSDPRQIARPLNAVCRFGKIFLRNSAFGCFQLHDDASEALRERIVNVAGHAISFRHDGRLAALLRQAHQLNSQHGLVGQRLGQFDFVFLKRALLRETDADDSGNTSGDQHWDEENGPDTQSLQMFLEQQQGRIGTAIFHYPMPHRVGVCPNTRPCAFLVNILDRKSTRLN